MSTEQLTQEIVRLLIPYLPNLIKGLKIGAKKAAEKLGEISAEKSVMVVEKLWGKLTRRKHAQQGVLVAAKKLSQDSKDKASLAIVHAEVKSLLRNDTEFRKEIIALMSGDGNTQTIKARRNINSKVEQTSTGSGNDQAVWLDDNRGVEIRQNIKK